MSALLFCRGSHRRHFTVGPIRCHCELPFCVAAGGLPLIRRYIDGHGWGVAHAVDRDRPRFAGGVQTADWVPELNS